VKTRGGVHDGCTPPLPFTFLPNKMERRMDKTRPTVAEVLSRTATLPNPDSGGGLLDRLLGGTRDVRTSARTVLETLYVLPGMDATSGYRREDTRVEVRSDNGLVAVTLVRPGHPRVTIAPGATAGDRWSVTVADRPVRRMHSWQIPDDLATQTGHPVRRSSTEGSYEARGISELRAMRPAAAVILGGLCAVASTLSQIAVGAGGTTDAVVAGIVAGLLVFLVAWTAIWVFARLGDRMLEEDGRLAAPPRDALWEGLRTGYDAHGVVMERLRLRAAEAGLALDRDADARALELSTLLDGSLSRLSSAYGEALAMRGDGKTLARVETQCARVLEEIVSEMEREAEAKRLRTFDRVEDLRQHARRLMAEDRGLPDA
jgi:hypothetical protein